MSFHWTRRAFLGSALGLSAGSLLGACARTDRSTAQHRATAVETRPIVRPFGPDDVWIASPARELPVAYVSMATRRVFVDRDFRDRASWLLDAHISVSTWVWRIPLPGDSPLTPIPPGDERREFEELPIGAWDPSVEPARGDIRIVRGRAEPVEIDIGCAPIQRTSRWLRAPPLRLARSHGTTGDLVREDFRVVGSGHRTGDRDCTGEGEDVQILAWAHRD